MGTLHHSEHAATLVELALVLPMFLALMTGAFDVGRAVWNENTLAYAAREGTRLAIVNGSGALDPIRPGNEERVVDRVRDSATGVHGITVTVSWPDTIGDSPCYDRGCRVIVDASAQFVPIASQILGGIFQLTLRGGSQLVIQR